VSLEVNELGASGNNDLEAGELPIDSEPVVINFTKPWVAPVQHTLVNIRMSPMMQSPGSQSRLVGSAFRQVYY
jgi:hypothetical protein